MEEGFKGQPNNPEVYSKSQHRDIIISQFLLEPGSLLLSKLSSPEVCMIKTDDRIIT